MDATNDEHKIQSWLNRWPAANIAVRTGGSARLVVIDVDPRSGGLETLEMLESQCGQLPRTMVVQTGSGGLHIYLQASPGIRIASRSGMLPGIDVRSEGGYVIAPPSIHVSGQRYRWLHFQLPDPPAIPESWLTMLPIQKRPLEFPIPASLYRNPRATHRRCRRSGSRQQRRARSGNWESGSSKRAAGSGRRLADSSSSIPLNPLNISAQFCEQPTVAAYPDADDRSWLNPFHDTGKRVWAAARRCVVEELGTRTRRFGELVTALINIPELHQLEAGDLLPVIRWWFDNSVDNMREKRWAVIERNWAYAWIKWAKPETGAAWRARDFVQRNPMPEAAVRCRKPAKQALLGICMAMQREAGDGEWFLSIRTAADVLASLGHSVSLGTIRTWLNSFVDDGILVHPWKHVPGSLLAQRYMTAEAAVRQRPSNALIA